MWAARWNGPAPTAPTHVPTAVGMSSTAQHIWMIGFPIAALTSATGTPSDALVAGMTFESSAEFESQLEYGRGRGRGPFTIGGSVDHERQVELLERVAAAGPQLAGL